MTGIIFLVLLWLGPALLPGRVLLPLDIVVQSWPPWQQPNTAVTVHNPLITDVVDYIYPVKTFAAEWIKQGDLPLWNPYVLGGYPLTYNTQAGLWYPLSVLYYLLPPTTAVDLTIALQLVLGGLFMFAFLRRLRLRRPAAFLGVLLFLFNGMMVVWLEWQVVHAAVIWLPLSLYFIERLAQGGGVRDAVLGGAAFAMPWLGGHWNWALYGSLTTAVYLLWRVGGPWLRQKRSSQPVNFRPIGFAVLYLAVGVGLSLIQVLPAFVYLRQGHRRPFALAESLALGLKDRAIVGLLPDFFGNPIHWDWWGPTNYNETTFYLGILPLFLVATAVAWRWRSGPVRFFALWGGLTALWALGTPVYGVLWLLPVFDGLWPSRAITAVLFCLSVLAAFGLDALLRPAIDRRRLWRVAAVVLGIIGLTLAGYGWLYHPSVTTLRPDLLWLGVSLVVSLLLLLVRGKGWVKLPVWAGVVLLWVAVDLYWAGYDYNTIGHTADLYPPTETARFLQQQTEPYRIATLPQGVAYPPNSNLQDRLPAISGYEPAILQTWVDYISAAEGQTAIYFERELMPIDGLESPLLDAVNMKYVVTIGDWFREESTLGPAQTAVTDWLPLTETAVNQPFTMPDAGLHRVDLPLTVADGAAGEVTVRVLAPDGGQEFANAAWDVDEQLTDGWTSFYFGSFPSEWGRNFLLRVEYAGDGLVQVGAGEETLAYRAYYLPRPALVHEAGKTRVYENGGAFPRAYLVPEGLVAPNPAQALDRVLANQDRLDEVVVLEIETQVDSYLPGGRGTAVITAYEPNQVRLQTETDGPAYLVLADTYYPGWQATVDGEPTAVHRANGVVRAVTVPEGVHEVVFTFRPMDFYAGAMVTAVTLAGCLLLLVLDLWRRRGR